MRPQHRDSPTAHAATLPSKYPSSQTNPGEGGGQVVSPFSIAQALAMLLNGAEPGSPSYEQIAVSLGKPLATGQTAAGWLLHRGGQPGVLPSAAKAGASACHASPPQAVLGGP